MYRWWGDGTSSKTGLLSSWSSRSSSARMMSQWDPMRRWRGVRPHVSATTPSPASYRLALKYTRTAPGHRQTCVAGLRFVTIAQYGLVSPGYGRHRIRGRLTTSPVTSSRAPRQTDASCQENPAAKALCAFVSAGAERQDLPKLTKTRQGANEDLPKGRSSSAPCELETMSPSGARSPSPRARPPPGGLLQTSQSTGKRSSTGRSDHPPLGF
jgi:hypothetical protein